MIQQFAGILKLASGQKVSPAVHSGKVEPGGAFFVLPASVPGTKSGLDFLDDALAAGASYLVFAPEDLDAVSSICSGNSCPVVEWIVVPDVRTALGIFARAYYRSDNPGRTLAGITGTNGKTTCAYLLEAVFEASGRRVGVMGTINYRWPGFSQPAPLTTPGCIKLHSMLAKMNNSAVDATVMEVSSHALDQQRVAGLDFGAALFTNMTQDHLDYHQDMESYYQSKAKLFHPATDGGFPLDEKVRAINFDDPYGRRLLDECKNLPGRNIGFGLGSEQAAGERLQGEIIEITPDGIRLRQSFAGQEWELKSPLVGAFNAMNLLGVQAVALGLGMSVNALKALESFQGVPGRLERISNSGGLNAFVDYAHTPDALEKAIKALRDAGFKRIVTVFGCGGNRDRTKRPLMAHAACAGSDVVVLTSDNPRNEDPMAIINDVLPGMHGAEYHVEADRARATALAVDLLKPGDALLVAGKGHEDYQIIGDTKIYYSDQAVLRELMGVEHA